MSDSNIMLVQTAALLLRADAKAQDDQAVIDTTEALADLLDVIAASWPAHLPRSVMEAAERAAEAMTALLNGDTP
jgi:hypothetical protein